MREAGIRAIRNGANVTIASLRSHVGSGSDEHCLSGDDLMLAATSTSVLAVRSWRRDRSRHGTSLGQRQLFYPGCS